MAAVIVLGAALPGDTLRAAEPLHTITVTERFGVSHPDQILDADLPTPVDPKTTRLEGPDGKAEPFQLLDGGRKIAFRVRGGLPANASRTWRLVPGAAGPAEDGVRVEEPSPDYVEIRNGVTGVRMARRMANPQRPPAPIQGVLLPDGKWTATGPNALTAAGKSGPARVRSLNLTFRERGPLRVSAEVTYAFEGTGRYVCTIMLDAGQPSAVVEEWTDLTAVSYSFDVSAEVRPDQARYRGHHATAPTAGRTVAGKRYGESGDMPAADAVVDLDFSRPVGVSYRTTPETRPRLALWNPWSVDTGRYWHLYDSKAGPDGPVVGVFAGRVSRALGAAASGPGVFTAAAGSEDFTTAVGPDGAVHAAYRSGPDLWYLHFDAKLAPSAPRRLGVRLEQADVLADERGVHVLACEVGTGRRLLVEFSGKTEPKTTPVVLSGLKGGMAVAPPHAGGNNGWQASRGDTHFLVVPGVVGGKPAALLFARKFGQSAFLYRDVITDFYAEPTVARQPSFQRGPKGVLRFLFTNQGGYVEEAVIAPTAQNFGGSQKSQRLFSRHRHLNFGAALDPTYGHAAGGDEAGRLWHLAPNGAPDSAELNLAVDHHGRGPNRRTLAAAPDGTAVLVHGDKFYRRRTGGWSAFPEADTLGLAGARAHYLPGRREFLFVGFRSGVLSLYAWQPTDPAPRSLRTVAGAGRPSAGITVQLNAGTPEGSHFPEVRFQWGLFVGTKGRDLPDDPSVTPGIARQMNLHAGVNLNKVYRLPTTFDPPPGGFGSPYQDPAVVRRLIDRVRNDDAHYRALYTAEPTARPLLDAWKDATGKQATRAAAEVPQVARDLLDALVNGDGILTFRFHYWHGGLELSRKRLWIDVLLADDRLAAQDKARLQAAAVLFGDVLWDHDFVPMFDGHGFSMGTANMPVQQAGYQGQYALFLSSLPEFARRAGDVYDRTLASLRGAVNEAGAPIGSPHYAGASVGPTLITLLELKRRRRDAFRAEPRLARLAEFYLNVLTPPEPRFGGRRKLVAIGDGSTEGTEIPGLLATGFRDVNPTLNARLAGAWKAGGQVHSGFFGSTLLMIDDEAPTADPGLGDADFPGYLAVLRHAAGTERESAAWFVRGDHYRDHRHPGDAGSVAWYALGAPGSVNWGSFYSPPATGSAVKNAVSLLEHVPWDGPDVPLAAGTTWGRSTAGHFLSFTDSAAASARFAAGKAEWERRVCSLRAPTGPTVLVVDDELRHAGPAVLTWQLMAEGAVQTPAGAVRPPERLHRHDGAAARPSLGPRIDLSAGVSRFAFAGSWGVDLDLYAVADQACEARLGNWGHTWAPTPEAVEFQKSARRPFQESQHTLRVKGGPRFRSILVAHAGGRRPADLTATQEGEATVLRTATWETAVGPAFAAQRSADRVSLATFDARPTARFGLGVSGGPAEVVIAGRQATVILHGPGGARRLTIPGRWRTSTGGDLPAEVNYAGGTPLRVMLQSAP